MLAKSTAARQDVESIETYENEVYGINHKAQAIVTSNPKGIVDKTSGNSSRKLHKDGTDSEDIIETTPNVVYGMI